MVITKQITEYQVPIQGVDFTVSVEVVGDNVAVVNAFAFIPSDNIATNGMQDSLQVRREREHTTINKSKSISNTMLIDILDVVNGFFDPVEEAE